MRIESNRFYVFGQVSELSVFHHADDFDRLGGIRSLDAKAFAERRAASGKESLDHRLADHCDFLRAGRVLRAEGAPHYQRNTHRCEKVRADDVVSDAAECGGEVRLIARVSRTGPN